MVVAPYDASGLLGAPFPVLLSGGVERRGDAIRVSDLPGLTARVVAARLGVERRLSGGELRFLRKAAMLRADRLALGIGIPAAEYADYERDAPPMAPSIEKFARICLFHAVRRALGDEDQGRRAMNDYLSYAFEQWRPRPVSADASRAIALRYLEGTWVDVR